MSEPATVPSAATTAAQIIGANIVVVDPHRPAASPVLIAIEPPQADSGVPFSPQPDGESALIIETRGATPGTRVVMADHELTTTFADPTRLTALVPAELLQHAGRLIDFLQVGEDVLLRRILGQLVAHVQPKPEVFIGAAQTKFDAQGKLTDETTRKFLTELLAGFKVWIERMRIGK